jgi:hypothetical protein
MLDYHYFFHQFLPIYQTTVTDWITAVGSVGAVFIASLALKQVSHQARQNDLTTEQIAIEELRHFERFLNAYEELNILVREKNTDSQKLSYSEMQDFTLSESSKSEFKSNMANWHSFFSKNEDVQIKATRCANSLEVIAVALEHGTAKLEIIEDVIAPAFCNFVDNFAYVYIRHRNDALNLYKNTINLYKKIKPKVKTISEQTALIQVEVQRILGKN